MYKRQVGCVWELGDRHFTAVEGQPNTWDFETSQFYGSILSHRTWVVTAVNDTASVTANAVLP